MTTIPNILQAPNVPAIRIQEYERYLPSAFDDSLTMLEKINKMIHQLNLIGGVSNDIVNQWNELIKWILGNGLTDIVVAEIDKKIADGTFNDLFEAILGNLNSLETVDKTTIVNAINEINRIAVKNRDNIGDMSILTTDDKETLVEAINEIKKQELMNRLAPIMIAEATGHGIISGFKVTQQPVLSMGVDIGNNVVPNIIHMKNGDRFTLNSISLPVDNSHATLSRKDIFFVSGAGVVTYLKGVAASNPVVPLVPVGGELLCEIIVVPNDTTINDIDITDGRALKALTFLETNAKANLVQAINELVVKLNENEVSFNSKIGILNELPTSDKSNLVNSIKEFYQKFIDFETTTNQGFIDVFSKIGDLDTLPTEQKDNIVDSIIEMFTLLGGEIGDLPKLNTSNKSSLVNAINELLNTMEDDYALKVDVGDKLNLNTTDKTNIVNAINEVSNELVSNYALKVDVGDKLNLKTNNKTNIVNAVNELSDKLETTGTYVNVKSFGAKGDGISDDSTAIQNALNFGNSLYFPKGIYRTTKSLMRDYTGNSEVILTGDSSTILLDSVSHLESMVVLRGQGVDFKINSLNFDGNKKCNKVIEFDNLTDNMNVSTLSNIKIDGITVENAKRLSTFSGGAGISVRGAYGVVDFSNTTIKNCELPKNQGTISQIGMSGLLVTHYGLRSFVIKTIVYGCSFEKIYSSDLTYPYDQDGLIVFSPHGESSGGYIKSELFVDNCSFLNCYGRSIKSQVYINTVVNSFFERTEGMNSKNGIGEIDYQISGGIVNNCTFTYSGGFQPNNCVHVTTDVGYGHPSLFVSNCFVYLDELTTLESFASTAHSTTSLIGQFNVSNINIYGKVRHAIELRVNGNKGYSVIKDIFVTEIVTGRTSEKALIYVTSSGLSSPFIHRLSIHSCQYAGIDLPALVRDNIPGNGATTIISSFDNVGFANDKKANINDRGLRNGQIARLGKIGSDLSSVHETGFFEVKTYVIGATETLVIPVRNVSGTLLFINSTFNQNSFAIISSGTSQNIIVAKGSEFEIGHATEPVGGSFKVWSSGVNEISIKNTLSSGRDFSVFEMCPS